MSDSIAVKHAICVVVPTYNNCATIREVIKSILAITDNLIVVNDGCDDGTENALKEFPSIEVVKHKTKMGKGAALADGLQRAVDMGFTHGISFDADGQHLASDIPKFMEAIKENPEAMIIGKRDLSGKGRALKSRVLRLNSNFWVWLMTGKKKLDSQSGFRVYPLSSIQNLALTTTKYDYEIEVLVKAIWLGVPVTTVPIKVSYGPGSKSHFRPFKDFLLVAHLNIGLLIQVMFIPGPMRKVIHLKKKSDSSDQASLLRLLWGAFKQDCSSPSRFSLSVGLGVFFGIIPLWGFQMLAAFFVAQKLRLSKIISVAASNISFPAAIPFILYASVLLGQLLVSGELNYSLDYGAMSQESVWNLSVEYLVGSFALALIVGLLATVLSYMLTRFFNKTKEGEGNDSEKV